MLWEGVDWSQHKGDTGLANDETCSKPECVYNCVKFSLRIAGYPRAVH